MAQTRAYFAGAALVPTVIMYLRIPYTPLAAEDPIAILTMFLPFMLPVAIYLLGVRGRRWTIGCGVLLVAFAAGPWVTLMFGVEPPGVFMALGMLIIWPVTLIGSGVTLYRAAARRLRKPDLAA